MMRSSARRSFWHVRAAKGGPAASPANTVALAAIVAARGGGGGGDNSKETKGGGDKATSQTVKVPGPGLDGHRHLRRGGPRVDDHRHRSCQLVGSEFSGTVDTSGTLFLGINDVGVENNEGEFKATVTVE